MMFAMPGDEILVGLKTNGPSRVGEATSYALFEVVKLQLNYS